jgi:hypothetical protein
MTGQLQSDATGRGKPRPVDFLLSPLGRKSRTLFNQALVFVMRADPEPNHLTASFTTECPVVCSYSNGPVFAHGLKVQRWVTGIGTPQTIVFDCRASDFQRKSSQSLTKIGGRRGFHPTAAARPPEFPFRHFPTGGRVCRSWHPDRFGGPTRRHGVRADAGQVRRICRAAILQLLFLFPANSSHIQTITDGTCPSSPGFNGAAPAWARNFSVRQPHFATAHTSTEPRYPTRTRPRKGFSRKMSMNHFMCCGEKRLIGKRRS